MIRDGRGTGYLAGVNKYGQLDVVSAEPKLAWISRTQQKAFVVNAEITGDETPNNIFILQNPSSTSNVIVSELSMSSMSSLTLIINLNETYSSGGTGISPVNLNCGSRRTSIVTNTNCYYGNDMTFTGDATVYSRFSLTGAPFRESFSDALILTTLSSLSVNINAGILSSVFVSLRYYEVDAE